MAKRFLLPILLSIFCLICCVSASAEDIVYLDGTGATADAYTDLVSAVSALPNGGTIVVTGDTTVGTSTTPTTLSAVGGKVTITSREGDTDYGAKLTIARSLTLGSELEFNNITLSNSHSSRGTIICCGNTITMGEGVVTMAEESANGRYFNIYGGATTALSADSHIILKSGEYRNIFGGNAGGTFTGTSKIEIENATVQLKVTGGNESGTFSGTSEILLYGNTSCGNVSADNITIDLTNLGSVSATSFTGEISTVVPDGYELVATDVLYMVREITTEPAPALVYVDGTRDESGDGLTRETAVKTIYEAAVLMRDGGTIVVCGDTDISANTVLPASGELVITSNYGENFTESAAIRISANLTLGAPTTFHDIVLDKVASGNDYIIAAGNKLHIGTNVFCRNNLASNYITIIGGNMTDDYEGNSEITIESGYFRNVYGGNYNGTFKGDSNITITGGYFDNSIVGGSFMGNFEGDSHINIGGEAVMVYLDSTQGVIGSCCGSGSTPYTFDGNIYINLYGGCRINNSVYGASRYSNVTTTGNVEITLSDDAFIYQNLYAGGYAGTLNGDTRVVMNGGEVGVNLAGGNRSGTVNGSTYVEVNGGRVSYFNSNQHSSYSDVAGTYNLGGGGLTGAVTGNTTVVISGGSFFGNIYGGGISTGTVGGNSTVTVSGASVMCGIYADGATSGSVSGTKTLTVDLSEGGDLTVGLPMNATELIGGGAVYLAPGADITTDKLSGTVNLKINGIPLAKTYIKATEVADGASVSYSAREDEVFTQNTTDTAIEYAVSSTGYYATTKVTIKHHANATISLREGIATDTEKLAATSSENGETVYDLAPGFYNYLVYHSSPDYMRKYLYITGKDEAITVDLSYYIPRLGTGFEAGRFAAHTEEVLENFYGTEDLVGYETPDTPYFTKYVGIRKFTTNDDLNEYVSAKDSSCDYMYSFDLFTSSNGYTMPLVLFTKDAIPEGATLEEAAKIVSADKERDIIFITGGVHGNEPSGSEGPLALIGELCGDYANEILTDTVGAIVIIPRLNPEGYYSFTRNTPVNGDNLNRDYFTLNGPEIAGVVKAYNLFMPTFTVDCHEAPGEPKYSGVDTLTDVYDVGIMFNSNANAPFKDGAAVAQGDETGINMNGFSIVTEALTALEERGLRGYYYNSDSSPAMGSSFCSIGGAYAMILEIPGISAGDSFFGRRVYAQVSALKEMMAIVRDRAGNIAREVNAAREETALTAQVYDINEPYIIKHGTSRLPISTLTWNNKLVAADGTVRVADNMTYFYLKDVAVAYRAMPTAYVLSADTANIATVLEKLALHSINYYKLAEGTTLTLRQYSGTSDSAKLGEESDVTFANGAYIVPLDGANAYIIATLFEPDNRDTYDYIVSFTQAGTLAASDIYRSTESFIATKLGIESNYMTLEIADGAVLTGVTVDGVAYTEGFYGYEGTNAYVPTSNSESYTVELAFEDGSIVNYTIEIVKGDANGDGKIDLSDVLTAIRALLKGSVTDKFDMNDDGKFSLVDILKMMKLIAGN